MALTSLIRVIDLITPFTPIATAIGMGPLPLAYFPWGNGILVAYALLKTWYIRRFREWL